MDIGETMGKRIRVGCYGAKGSYTYEAMERHFGEREREEIYFPLFEDVTKAAAGGRIDYGVIPLKTPPPGGLRKSMTLSGAAAAPSSVKNW